MIGNVAETTTRRKGTRRQPSQADADLSRIRIEWNKCSRSPAYFICTYAFVADIEARGWLPFKLWAAQRTTLDTLINNKLVIVLKARQLGLSWLVLGYALWLMLFRPAAVISLFSKRDDEAIDLLDTRLKGMYERLPVWMRCREVMEDSKHIWRLSNGSIARAFPTTGGESYAVTLAVIDEADKTPDLNVLLNAVQPTVDAGGKLFLVSTVDKSKPRSTFKRIYEGAKEGRSSWRGVFLPWQARPGRDDAWYAEKRADIFERTGALDDLWQEYPACLTAETRVSTEQGIIPIAEAHDARSTESGPIARWGEQPPSQIWRLTTEQGRVLRGTHEHLVMTDQGLVSLASLQFGDAIVLRPPCFAEHPYIEKWHPLSGMETRLEITPEWARLIGLFMGDGCWYKGGVDIACDSQDQDVVEEVEALLEKLIAPSHRKVVGRIPGRAGCTYVSVHRKEASVPFLRLGLVRHSEINHHEGGAPIRRWVHVPECIWCSPKSIVREFLRGLFESDGSASSNKVRWATTKIEFAREVQLLLLGFDINAPITANHKRAGSGRLYESYMLALNYHDARRFHDEIGFIGARKNAQRFEPSSRGQHGGPRALTDRVVSVVEDGIEPTWDFALATDEHLFTANGILTHNTDAEALAPNTLDKRIPAAWLLQCFYAAEPAKALPYEAPSIPGVDVYQLPLPGHQYVIGADPAEGNPTSDDSAFTVIDRRTGVQVASMAGKFQPSVLAAHIDKVGKWYNRASVMVERNNHGHAVLLWLRDNSRLTLLRGHDRQEGWLSSSKGKALMYDAASDAARNREVTIHNHVTYLQLASIEGSTLLAPEGEQDDMADAFALAVVGSTISAGSTMQSNYLR